MYENFDNVAANLIVYLLKQKKMKPIQQLINYNLNHLKKCYYAIIDLEKLSDEEIQQKVTRLDKQLRSNHDLSFILMDATKVQEEMKLVDSKSKALETQLRQKNQKWENKKKSFQFSDQFKANFLIYLRRFCFIEQNKDFNSINKLIVLCLVKAAKETFDINFHLDDWANAPYAFKGVNPVHPNDLENLEAKSLHLFRQPITKEETVKLSLYQTLQKLTFELQQESNLKNRFDASLLSIKTINLQSAIINADKVIWGVRNEYFTVLENLPDSFNQDAVKFLHQKVTPASGCLEKMSGSLNRFKTSCKQALSNLSQMNKHSAGTVRLLTVHLQYLFPESKLKVTAEAKCQLLTSLVSTSLGLFTSLSESNDLNHLKANIDKERQKCVVIFKNITTDIKVATEELTKATDALDEKIKLITLSHSLANKKTIETALVFLVSHIKSYSIQISQLTTLTQEITKVINSYTSSLSEYNSLPLVKFYCIFKITLLEEKSALVKNYIERFQHKTEKAKNTEKEIRQTLATGGLTQEKLENIANVTTSSSDDTDNKPSLALTKKF